MDLAIELKHSKRISKFFLKKWGKKFGDKWGNFLDFEAKELNNKIDDIQKRKYKPPKNHPWKSHFPRTYAI